MPILFVGIGSLFLLISFSLIRITFAKKRFEKHIATITSSKVTSSYSNITGAKYRVSISCRYQWNDKDYEGAPALFHYPLNRHLSSLNEIVDKKFPTGSTTEIYINPNNPSEFVFEKEIKLRDIISSISSLILGGGVLYLALKPCLNTSGG